MVTAIDKKIIHEAKKILVEIMYIAGKQALECEDLVIKQKIIQSLKEVKDEYDKIV